MFSGLYRFIKNCFGIFSASQDAPPIQINFQVSTLCSPKEGADLKVWLNAYLQLFENNVILLWSDTNHKLNAAFSYNKRYFHVKMEEYSVENASSHIIYQEQEVNSLQEILGAIVKKGFTVPEGIAFPSSQECKDKQFKVNISQKHITLDMLRQVEIASSKIQENLEKDLNCPICFEGYSVKSPAHLLVPSLKIYHQACIQKTFDSQRQGGRELRDPITRELIARPRERFNFDGNVKLIHGFQNVSTEYADLFEQNRLLCTMLKIMMEQQTVTAPSSRNSSRLSLR